MKLSDNEKELLHEAAYIYRRPEQSTPSAGGNGWFKPKDVGGRDGSYHSRVLRKLAGIGLLETEILKWAAHPYRGSRRYRITERGLNLDQEINAPRATRDKGRGGGN